MKVILSLILLFNLQLLHASSPGSTALSFLKIDTGAKPSAMAGAYTSYGDDAFSMFYNPALLVNLKKHRVDVMHFEYLEDINYENISAAFKIKNLYSMGLGINYLYASGIARTVRANNMDGYKTTGTFGSSDLMIVVCNSLKLNKKMSLGINVKYISETIDKEGASTFAGDIGFFSHLSLPVESDFGVSILNIGLPIKYIEKKENLPILIRIGVSKGFNLFNLNKSDKKDLNISLNAEKPIDNDVNFRLGLESWFIDMIALRLGYKLNLNKNDLGNISLGVGLEIKQFSISYAFVPYKYLNNTHRFSAGIRF